MTFFAHLLVTTALLFADGDKAFSETSSLENTTIPEFNEDLAKTIYERLWVDIAIYNYETPRIAAALLDVRRARGFDDKDKREIYAWRLDPARGALVNELETAPSQLKWIHEGYDSTPEPGAHGMMIWPTILMFPEEGPLQLMPKHCVPEACYFVSNYIDLAKGRRAVNKPGMWLALRKKDSPKGQWILAGALIHKTAPKDPLKHPLFLKWRAELVTRFPAEALEAE